MKRNGGSKSRGIPGWEQANLVTVKPSPCPAPARSGWKITVRHSVSTEAWGESVLAGEASHLCFLVSLQLGERCFQQELRVRCGAGSMKGVASW